jgi:hypothetical protein
MNFKLKIYQWILILLPSVIGVIFSLNFLYCVKTFSPVDMNDRGVWRSYDERCDNVWLPDSVGDSTYKSYYGNSSVINRSVIINIGWYALLSIFLLLSISSKSKWSKTFWISVFIIYLLFFLRLIMLHSIYNAIGNIN